MAGDCGCGGAVVVEPTPAGVIHEEMVIEGPMDEVPSEAPPADSSVPEEDTDA